MRDGWHDKQIEALTWGKRCRLSYRQIAEITGRTVDACQRMAQRLGLQVPKDTKPVGVVDNDATAHAVTPETQRNLDDDVLPTPGHTSSSTFRAPEFPPLDTFPTLRTPKAVRNTKRKS